MLEILFLCVFPYMYVCVVCVQSLRRALDHLELELQIVASRDVGSGN